MCARPRNAAGESTLGSEDECHCRGATWGLRPRQGIQACRGAVRRTGPPETGSNLGVSKPHILTEPQVKPVPRDSLVFFLRLPRTENPRASLLGHAPLVLG